MTLLFSGATDVWAAELALADRQADFKEFVQDVAENYAWPDRTEKPWLTLAGALRRGRECRQHQGVAGDRYLHGSR